MDRNMWRWMLATLRDGAAKAWLRANPEASVVLEYDGDDGKIYDACAGGTHLRIRTDRNGSRAEVMR